MHIRQLPAGALSAATPATEAQNNEIGAGALASTALETALQRPESADKEVAQEQPAPEKPEEESFLDYLQRSKLSVVAKPLTDIDVQFPEEVTGIVDLKVQFTLFIDEYGVVRRVRFDSAAIPSAFSAAVLDTFMKSRFKPAEVENVAVRSQVRLEVEFRANRT